MIPQRGMGHPFVGGQQLGMGVPIGFMNRPGPGRPPPSAMLGPPPGSLNRGAGSPPPATKGSPHHGPQPNPSVAGLTPPVTARSRQLLANQNKTVSSLTSLGQSSARTLSVPSTPTLPSALPADGQGKQAEVALAPPQQQPDLA